MGQGPDLVMLHGWSMHSGVWHQLAALLAENFTLHLVDLPGHGSSDWHDNAFEMDGLVEQLAEQLPAKAHFLGWSLGGLVATAFAHEFVDRVNKLVLIAATPCFVKAPNWPNAMEPTVFNAFAENLNDNQQETLQRFLMLQARGSAHSRDTIRQLSEQLAQQTPAQPEALTAGLSVLIHTDLRKEFEILKCPVKVILGQRDTLIPVAVSDDFNSLQATADITVIESAGHAPFISHPADCQIEIESFLHDN